MAEVDAKMEEVYAFLVREALDASVCLEGRALQVNGAPPPSLIFFALNSHFPATNRLI